MVKYFVCIIILLGSSWHPSLNENNNLNKNTSSYKMEENHQFCKEISDLGYNKIFRFPDSEVTIGQIWDNGKNRNKLLEIISDNELSGECRFWVSEILFKKDIQFINNVRLDLLADIYLKAALGNYTEQMSDWGFGLNPNYLGPYGKKVMIFGDASVQVWLPFINDETKISYNFLDKIEGEVNYRIKDLAALFISHTKGIEIDFNSDVKKRDGQIKKLIRQIEEQKND